MTATLLCVDTYEHVDELIWCLEQNFPAPVTEALLTLLDDTKTLPQAFKAWKVWGGRPRYEFIDAVEEVVSEYCSLCDDCEQIVWDDDTTTINGHRVCDAKCLDSYYWCDYCSSYATDATSIADETVCDSCCSEHFTCCYQCEHYVHDDEVTHANDRAYCESCRDRYLCYCDECEEWYIEGDHNHACDCEAPHRRFTFPANGSGVVEQDERLEVSLPTGTIDDEGFALIRHLLLDSMDNLANVNVRMLMDGVGPLWQAKRGNFTRRLSSAFYSQHRIKLDPTVVSEIGNLARAHSSDEATWYVEFTRDLNQNAEAFAHSSSCWWGGYVPSRCALKSWGGLGMRTYPDLFRQSGSPSGRMWIQPLDEDLCPTHDALNAHAYVLYNGYGVLSGYTAPRIVAHLAGRTYRKIEVTSNVDNSYINGDTGYLVADEATCASTESVAFNYDEHDNFDAHNLMRVAA